MQGKKARSLKEIADLERYHVVIGLAKDVSKKLPAPPRKTVFLDWNLPNPAEFHGTAKETHAAYEETYREIEGHISDLAEAILGEKTK